MLASSRLLKKRQHKLVQQALIFIFLAILLTILFINFILPQLLELFFGQPNEQLANLSSIDQTPPVAPSLDKPINATFSSLINLKGFAEPESDIFILLNKKLIGSVKTQEDGVFTYELPLQTGNNEVTLYARDQAGNESVQSVSYQIWMDNQPIELEIESPANESKIELRKNQLITVKGRTKPQSKLYFNNKLVFSDTDGNFTTTYSLVEGENNINVQVIDRAGNSKDFAYKLYFNY